VKSNNGKRHLEVEYQDDSTPGAFHTDDNLPSSMPIKPTKCIKLGNQKRLDLECLLIHRVECGRSINHNHHPEISFFLDTPKLFAGDNKASLLRSIIPITNVDEHLEDN
jgi:hypothetical protein